MQNIILQCQGSHQELWGKTGAGSCESGGLFRADRRPSGSERQWKDDSDQAGQTACRAPPPAEIRINGARPGIETKKIISYLPDQEYLNNWMRVG